MSARTLIASTLLATSLMAAPVLAMATGPNDDAGGAQMAQNGTLQQDQLRTRDRVQDQSATSTPAGDQVQARKQARSQDRAMTRAEKKAQKRDRTQAGH